MSGYASGATSGALGQPPVSAADQPRELLSLSHTMTTQGEILLVLSGELDVSSAEQAFGYVRDAIDRHKAPVVVDLASLNFCDARGLGMFVRMSKYAKQARCSLQLTAWPEPARPEPAEPPPVPQLQRPPMPRPPHPEPPPWPPPRPWPEPSEPRPRPAPPPEPEPQPEPAPPEPPPEPRPRPRPLPKPEPEPEPEPGPPPPPEPLPGGAAEGTPGPLPELSRHRPRVRPHPGACSLAAASMPLRSAS